MMALLKQFCRAAWVASLMCSAPLLQATDNNLHFYGKLTSTMCDLVAENGVLDTVTFPQMAAPDLAIRGRSQPMPVTLRLTNCAGLTLENGVQVVFNGTEAPSLPGYVALDSVSLASGFAIGLETQQGKPVALNDSGGVTFMLNEGNNTLILNAWLQTIPGQDVTSGAFTATVTATFEYL